MRVDIWSDIVCPWCYIGKRRFERALDAFPAAREVEVRYCSFQLDPGIPRGEVRDVVSELVAKKGASEAQIRQMMSSVEALAKEEGLEYHLAEGLAGNTVDAHRLVHVAAERDLANDMLERLYTAQFTDLRSVFDRDSLIGLAEEVELDRADAERALDDDLYARRVAEDEELARSYGITGVPFFVIDERFGISGAQSAEIFADALQQAWQQRPKLQSVGTAPGVVCEDGDCYPAS